MRADFPLPDITAADTAGFWEGCARDELVIPRCDSCGRYQWYPRPVCPACKGDSFTWAPMSGRATLFSWVVVTHPFLPQFADKVPFVTALVALDEDPAVRLPTQIVDCEPADLSFDLALEVTFRDLTFTGVEGSVRAPFFRLR